MDKHPKKKHRKRKKETSIFEELDRCNLQIKEGEEKRKFRLGLYNGLFTNGHVAKMKNAALTYLALGDKCTLDVILNGEEYYLVYKGKCSEKIITNIAKDTGKSKRTVKRDLKRLKKLKLVYYQTQDGVGFRIAVKPIKGAFERRFKECHQLGQNVQHLGQNVQDHRQNVQHLGQNVQDHRQNVQHPGQNDLCQNVIGKEKPKENKEGSETGKNEGALYKDLNNKDKRNNNNKDVAAVVSQIFKGTVKTDKVKDRIQGKNPDEVIALARYCQEESSAKNPVGLFFTMLREGTKPPAPATKTRLKIPKPKGGYQTGREPLFDSSFYMSCVPEQAVTIAQQKFPKDIEKAVERLLVIYHKKFDPRDYYKSKEQLTEEESKNMMEIIEKWEKIPD